MTSISEPSSATDHIDDMDEWIAAEEAKTSFASFDLGTGHGRQELLSKYYRIGETSLFEAVSHIWASLNEPKAAHCTVIGLAAGTGGEGKAGLVMALHKFLDEALDIDNPIPPRDDFETLEQWHLASMRTYEQDEQALRVLLEHYSAVLDGRSPTITPEARAEVVVEGPWLLRT
jgi:hypothetical protein